MITRFIYRHASPTISCPGDKSNGYCPYVYGQRGTSCSKCTQYEDLGLGEIPNDHYWKFFDYFIQLPGISQLLQRSNNHSNKRRVSKSFKRYQKAIKSDPLF